VICEETDSEEQFEIVLKTLGTVESGVRGMARELICSHLAKLLNIPTSRPAVVDIQGSIVFGGVHPSDLSARLGVSIGKNFGSIHLKDVVPPPRHTHLKKEAEILASSVFAFDLLIQNPDRRTGNPNLFWDHSRYIVYDHELALSFSMILGGFALEPWDLSGLPFISDHFFYEYLRGRQLNLDDFAQRLDGCSEEVIDGIIKEVPDAWITDEISTIREHLVSAGTHADRFVRAVQAEVSV
jgi:hypothetical protein